MKSFVGKIAVVKSGDGKHPHEIEANRRGNGRPAPADPKDREAAEMKDEEGNGAEPFDAVGFGLDGGLIFVAVIRVNPLHNGSEAGV